jgi:hypothetical protein
LRILEGLMTLKGERGGPRERLSYRALDVEQIGSVYETVMGFTVESTKHRALAVKAGKNNRTPVFVDLEKLAAVKGKDRIKFLKEEADRGQLSANVARAVETAKDASELAAALDSIVDERGSPRRQLTAIGAPVLQPTDERRRTGSHYTPRELTAPIVRHALEPAFERLGPDATPEQILDLKVCDPAMGSGAFLVEACRAIATKLVDAWSRYRQKKPVIPPDEDEELHARRLVAQRCLYGVDKNPLATDLAKLSLWLATLARDHEFTFLDHALKSGDSLVGLTQAQLAAAHWDTSKPGLPLFRQLVKDRVGEAMKGRAEIQAAPDDTARVIQEARHRFLEERIKDIRLIGDAVVAAFFAEETPRARERKRAEVESWLGGSPVAWDKIAALAAALKQGEHPLTPFHWEIEFPEVFARESGGFDAVIGNPPFVDSEIMTKEIPEIRDYIAHTYSSAKGNWDLYIPFIERAINHSGAQGTTALISPNKWFGAPYASALREASKNKLLAVLNFSNSRFFPGVGVAAICSVLRETQTPSIEVTEFSARGGAPIVTKIDRKVIKGQSCWGMLLSSHLRILSMMLSTGVRLGDYVDAHDPFTVSEAYELKQYIVERDCLGNKAFFKFVNTGTVDPYLSLWGITELRYLKARFVQPVIQKQDLKQSYPRRYSQACSPKIIISGMRKFESFLDADGEYVAGKSTVIVTAKEPSFSLATLLGILNSRLIRFFIQETFGVLGIDGGISFSGDIVKQLPLPNNFDSRIPSVENAVEYVLQRVSDQRLTSNLLNIVDKAVFDAYRIPEADRKTVMECPLQC